MAKRKLVKVRIDKLLPEPPTHTEYLTSLGRFVDHFAVVEVMLNALALRYSGVAYKKAKILFLPLRADAAIKLIKKLIPAKGRERRKIKELQAILAHVDELREVRNTVLHNGSSQTKTRRFAKNRFARAGVRTRAFNVSKSSLDKMIFDLTLIMYWGAYRHLNVKPDRASDELGWLLSAAMRPTVRKHYLDAGSWHYKPQPPPVHRRKARRQKGRETVPVPKPQI